MNRDDIIRMGVETDLFIYNGDDTSLTVWLIPTEEKFLKFAALVAAEKEQQMIRDGWRQCAEEQRTTQYCGLLDAAVKAEREKVAAWMHFNDYTTGHGDCIEDLLEEIQGQVAELERWECAEIAEAYEPRCDVCPKGVAAAIRARGET